MWTLLAIISLVILGGFLSYYGDLQGRRWGKKRVSLFGLRPKHTAILITSITGSVISLLSVITVLVAFPPIRDVILTGERAIRDNRRLLAELKEKNTQFDNQLKDQKMATALIQAQKDTAQSDLSQNQAELSRSLSELKERQNELATLTQTNVTYQTEIGKRRDEIRRQLVNIKRLTEQYRQKLALNNQLTTENKSATQLNTDLAHENLATVRTNLALKKQNEELDANYHALIAKQEKLVATNVELEKKNGVLSNSNNFLLAQSADTLKLNEEKKRQLQSEIQSLQARIAVINRQMQDLQIGTQDALRLAGTLRSQRIATRYGEVLARRTLDPHSRPEAVANEINALLEDASALSLLHGGSRGANGRGVFAVGQNQTLLSGTQQDAEKSLINALVKQYTASSTPTLLTAYTVANSVQGEQLPVEIVGTPVRPTYRKGETIVSTELDGGGSIVQVVDGIIRFLQKDVREAALNAGTQPQLNVQTGTQEVGTLTPAELVTLTDRIRRTGGRVRLTAVAATSLTTADPLRLTFKVERARNRDTKPLSDASSRD